MVDLDPRLIRLVEAIVFASAEPVPEHALAKRLPADADLAGILDRLKADYAERGIQLVRAGGAWVFRTAPDLAGALGREVEVPRKLGRATLETLAIIAYHQPITRAEIEEIRGVSLGRAPFDSLLQLGWIRPRGRRRTPGRPLTWATTDTFLHHFGLERIDDLPGVEELKATGLLDARPAIEAYAETAEDALAADAEDSDLPLLGEDMLLESANPLDPDDGDAPRPGST